MGNMSSEGQRFAKFLAFKVRVLKKKSAALAITAEVYASAEAKIRLILKVWQTTTMQPFDLKTPYYLFWKI